MRVVKWRAYHTGTPQHSEEEKDLLSKILDHLNETYGVNLADEDKIDIERIQSRLEENEELRAVVTTNNTLENIRYKFNKVVDSILLDFVHTKIDLYKKLSEPRVNKMFKSKWFEGYYKENLGSRQQARIESQV